MLEQDPACGDGIVEDQEECDAGEANSNEGECTLECTLQFCGDGHVGIHEGCDDGNTVPGDGYSDACVLEGCGNGVVTEGEECDDGSGDDTDACTSLCKNAVCGDEFIHAGVEQCDDGNMVDTDECTNACNPAACGDSIVHQAVEECDDGNLVDTDGCTNACTNATCGDSIVQKNVEGCDDGNMVDTDECTNSRAIAVCGDSIVHQGVEQCDDGNQDNLDGCASNCIIFGHRVFVTSTLHTGESTAPTVPTGSAPPRAQAASLPGNYKAWISTNVNNNAVTPANRFTHAVSPYVLVDGTKVADNWGDLTDGSLDHPINLTEHGQPPPPSELSCGNSNIVVRTGTASDGTLGMGIVSRCSNFTQAGGSQGAVGRAGATTTAWSRCSELEPCSAEAPIYCFQQ